MEDPSSTPRWSPSVALVGREINRHPSADRSGSGGSQGREQSFPSPLTFFGSPSELNYIQLVIRVISGEDTSLSFGPGAPELNESRAGVAQGLLEK